jgi:ATP-binding cassette subfamily F protein uup
VLSLLDGSLPPTAGRVRRGRTVVLEHLTQALDDLDPQGRVLETVEATRRVVRTATGEITATSLLERFGFTGDRLTARIGDLSGGERRRFQLLRLLLAEPNVLLLDEPTNDLDIETLNVLEDFLDDWPGTLVVVSHDRYFLERVTDVVYGLLDDGLVSMLPGGVEEYLRRRVGAQEHAEDAESAHEAPEITPSRHTTTRRGSAEEREARKVLARVEKQLEQVAARVAALNDEVLEHASDHERLTTLSSELSAVAAERDALEAEWLEAADLLE